MTRRHSPPSANFFGFFFSKTWNYKIVSSSISPLHRSKAKRRRTREIRIKNVSQQINKRDVMHSALTGANSTIRLQACKAPPSLPRGQRNYKRLRVVEPGWTPERFDGVLKIHEKRVFDVGGGGPAKRKLQRKRISKTLTPFRELTRRTALPRLVDKVSFTRSFCFPIFASQRRKAVSHKHDPYKSSQLLLCTLKTRMSCILCKVIATKIVVSISKPKKSIEKGANTSSWSSTSYHEIMNAFH